jgi:DNA adenine methylase
MMKTPITYYGGKQLMLNDILPLIEVKHNVYTEVFFGGGSVFFAKRPSLTETINDNNGMVVNFYECIKLHYHQLKPLIEASLVCREQWRRATDIYKNPASADKIQRAWAFWFAANFSFASKPTGGLKYSNYQYFSVPKLMSRKKKDFNDMLLQRIENTVIENKQAVDILKSRNTKDALHYIDPPYPGTDQGHYAGYSMDEFIQLLDMCSKLKGKFVLSSYRYPALEEFAKAQGWHQIEIKKRGLAGNGMHKKTTTRIEVLTMNYTPSAERLNLFDKNAA